MQSPHLAGRTSAGRTSPAAPGKGQSELIQNSTLSVGYFKYVQDKAWTS